MHKVTLSGCHIFVSSRVYIDEAVVVHAARRVSQSGEVRLRSIQEVAVLIRYIHTSSYTEYQIYNYV